MGDGTERAMRQRSNTSSYDAFAATGDEVSIADFSEWISIVGVD